MNRIHYATCLFNSFPHKTNNCSIKMQRIFSLFDTKRFDLQCQIEFYRKHFVISIISSF